jgi:hypothetical protein
VSEPQVIGADHKLRNGLYLKAIILYEDRIAFDVYASRPLGTAELVSLELTDTVGTDYEPLDSDRVIDGHGSIVFKPALPVGANLHLSQPGWGLHTYELTGTE